MKQYQIDKEQFISDLQGLLRIKSVRFDCGPETEKAPLGQGIYDAIEYMLDLGRRFGFRTKNVDGYCGWIEMGEGENIETGTGSFSGYSLHHPRDGSRRRLTAR